MKKIAAGAVALAVFLYIGSAAIAFAAQVESSITPDTSVEIALPQSTIQSGTSLGPNLIPNPTFQNSDSSGLPTGWNKGGYGINTRILSYPVNGSDDTKAVGVQITLYTSGDAKWYFTHVPVTSGKMYEFSDYYFSSVPSILDAQFKMSDGSYTYKYLGTFGANTSFQKATVQFSVPDGAVAVTVFHSIKNVGRISTDQYSLREIISDSVNLVSNSGFETMGADGNPLSWFRGGYGNSTQTYTYPAVGVNGSKAASVQISNYVSGDAKWYFKPITLAPGTYEYSDQYISNVTSYIDVRLHNADGSYTYKPIAVLPSANAFATAKATFTVPPGTQDITIFHLIESNGGLTIDNASVTEVKMSQDSIFTTGAVSLTFDDGWQSQYDNAVPKLKSSGVKGTFYIVSRQLRENGFTNFMTQDEVRQLYLNGNEVGAHTRTHPHLSTLTASQQQEEIVGSQQDLRAMNVGPVTTFAYPYGEYNQTSISIAKTAYAAARSTIDDYTTPSSDKYQLPHFSIKKDTTFADAKTAIDDAIAQKKWIILTFHQVENNNTDLYSTSPAVLNQIVDYVVQKNIRVVTVSEGIKDMNQ